MRNRAMVLMCVCMMACAACGDDGGATKPKPSTPTPDAGVDMAPDMTAPDMPEPDMAAPDMAEPDMAAPDMAMPDMAMDPMISGMWQLKKYENEAPTGDVIVSFELMNAMGSTEVLGTFAQGDQSGSTSGTFVSDTLSLEWDANAQTFQFVAGKVQGAGIVGNYNDPAFGGIPQATILVRP